MNPFIDIVALDVNLDKLAGLNPPGGNFGLGDAESSKTFLDILGLNLENEISPDSIPFDAFLTDSKSSALLSPVLAEMAGSGLLTPELSSGLLPELPGMSPLPTFGKETGNSFTVGTKPTLISDYISGNCQNNAEPLVIIEAPFLAPGTNSEKLHGLIAGTASNPQIPIDATILQDGVGNRPETAVNNQNVIIIQPETDSASLLKEVTNPVLWGNMASALNIRQLRISTPETASPAMIQESEMGIKVASLPPAIIEEGERIKPVTVISEPKVMAGNDTEEKAVILEEESIVPESEFDLGEDSPETEIPSRVTHNPGKIAGAIRQTAETLTSTVESAPRPEAASPVRESASPLRFVLPENLKGQTLESGRTIMIKMEPENLGSVRMTMSSVHDTITARLVVDSPLARAAVEANLNQLLEQLDRQGIKVDFFDVSVGGSLVGDNTREHTAPSTRHLSGRFANDFGKIWSGNDGLSSSLRLNYIGASGVNCLA